MHCQGAESLGAKADNAKPINPFEQFCELSLGLSTSSFTHFCEQTTMLPQGGHDGGHQGHFDIIITLMLPGAEVNAHILFVFLKVLVRHPHNARLATPPITKDSYGEREQFVTLDQIGNHVDQLVEAQQIDTCLIIVPQRRILSCESPPH